MNNELRWKQRFKNFEKAYDKLVKILNIESRSEWENMALIQAFEFTFELAWKTLKDHLEDNGFMDIASPKAVIRQAFASDTIQNGDVWMEGLKKRNETVHTYDEAVLNQTINFIQSDFAACLEQFYRYFQEEVKRS